MKFITTLLIALSLCSGVLHAQNEVESLASKPTFIVFGNVYHQHHDFFDQAFSFQGLEVGLMIHQKLLVGFYGSCFVTKLQAVKNNELHFIWIGQRGIQVGYIHQGRKRFHLGGQLQTGLFSLRSDVKNFKLFQTKKTAHALNGWVWSPQIFGELTITNWCKIRTGFAYNLYYLKTNGFTQSSDLNNISFTFGIVFGKNMRKPKGQGDV